MKVWPICDEKIKGQDQDQRLQGWAGLTGCNPMLGFPSMTVKVSYNVDELVYQTEESLANIWPESAQRGKGEC